MKQGQPKPKGFHCMVYGTPGSGKTTIASQMPRPVAILDVEGGSGWLYHELDQVDIYTISPEEDPSKEISAFLKAATTGRGNPSKYRSIAIDTVSALRSRHLQALTGDSLHIELGDYGIATNWLRRQLSMTQFAPQMIMWITHMKEDRDGPRIVYRPAGMSDTGLNACEELLDAIVFMGKTTDRGGEITRFLCTEEIDPLQGRIGIMAKDRTGFLPGFLELDEMGEDGVPPNMFMPFFGEIVKELGYHKAPRKTTKK